MIKRNIGLVLSIVLLFITARLTVSCEPYEPCWQCEQHYDREGVYTGETCVEVRCCEIYYPYECESDNW